MCVQVNKEKIFSILFSITLQSLQSWIESFSIRLWHQFFSTLSLRWTNLAHPCISGAGSENIEGQREVQSLWEKAVRTFKINVMGVLWCAAFHFSSIWTPLLFSSLHTRSKARGEKEGGYWTGCTGLPWWGYYLVQKVFVFVYVLKCKFVYHRKPFPVLMQSTSIHYE